MKMMVWYLRRAMAVFLAVVTIGTLTDPAFVAATPALTPERAVSETAILLVCSAVYIYLLFAGEEESPWR